MSDTVAPLVEPPIIPSEKPGSVNLTNAQIEDHQNELLPATETLAKTGIAQKIGRAADGVFQKFGIVRKGRGRPRNDGQPKKSDLVATEGGEPIAANQIPGGIPAAPVIDSAAAALFRRAIVSAVKGTLGIARDIARIFANAADIDRGFTDRALKKAEPEPEALQDFTEALDLVLKKHDVQPKHAEEISLAITGARLLAPYAVLIAEFRGEIARKRGLSAPAPAPGGEQ